MRFFSSVTNRKRQKNPMRWAGIIFSIVGGGLAAMGGVFFLNTFMLIQTGEHADAIVVDIVESHGDNGSTLYSPVVAYSCGEADITKKSNMASSSNSYAVGDHAFVYCDPDEPERFVMDSFIDKYFGGIFAIFGSIFLIIGLGTLLYIRIRADKIARIKAEGIPTQGTVTLLRVVTDRNTSYRVGTWENGIETFQNSEHTEVTVSFTHPATVQTIETLADAIPGDVTSSLKIGDKLTVYADPRNPDEYWIDVERFM